MTNPHLSDRRGHVCFIVLLLRQKMLPLSSVFVDNLVLNPFKPSVSDHTCYVANNAHVCDLGVLKTNGANTQTVLLRDH